VVPFWQLFRHWQNLLLGQYQELIISKSPQNLNAKIGSHQKEERIIKKHETGKAVDENNIIWMPAKLADRPLRL
jgi:hypothetical protein